MLGRVKGGGELLTVYSWSGGSGRARAWSLDLTVCDLGDLSRDGQREEDSDGDGGTHFVMILIGGEGLVCLIDGLGQVGLCVAGWELKT